MFRLAIQPASTLPRCAGLMFLLFPGHPELLAVGFPCCLNADSLGNLVCCFALGRGMNQYSICSRFLEQAFKKAHSAAQREVEP